MTTTQEKMRDFYRELFASNTPEYAAKWLSKNLNVSIKIARELVKKFDLAGVEVLV